MADINNGSIHTDTNTGAIGKNYAHYVGINLTDILPKNYLIQ